MTREIRIPSSIYSRLEKHACGFDTPINVIERLLDYYENSNPADSELVTNQPSVKETRSYGNSVEDWKEAAEIALGFKQGTTSLDDNADFIRNIYEKFCQGQPAYGVSGTNALEALLQIFKQYNPDKYDNAVLGLKKSIEQSDKPFVKMRKMIERVTGESFKR